MFLLYGIVWMRQNILSFILYSLSFLVSVDQVLSLYSTMCVRVNGCWFSMRVE